jgi:hypothetical protein
MILGALIYVINGLLSVFSFNQVKTEKRYKLIINGIIFFTLTILSVFFYLPEHLLEGILSLVIFGLPLVYSRGIVPKVLVRNVRMFNVICFFSFLISILIFVFF